MNSLKIILTAVMLSTTGLFAFAGFGLQLGQSLFSVAESSPESGIQGVTLTNGSFDNAYVLGGYLYVDAIPFIDLEFDLNVRGNTYDINFENEIGSMDPIPFGWASLNMYVTLRKNIIGLSIPFLAGAKIHAGGGYNSHWTTPIANIELVEDLLGDNLLNGDVSKLDKNLEDYLSDKDNYIDASGFHIQAGVQFKLFMIDSFLNYRYTIVEDVVPAAKNFGSLNFRLGFSL